MSATDPTYEQSKQIAEESRGSAWTRPSFGREIRPRAIPGLVPPGAGTGGDVACVDLDAALGPPSIGLGTATFGSIFSNRLNANIAHDLGRLALPRGWALQR